MKKRFLLTACILLASCGPPEPPLAACGNGIVEESEVCDDGNTANQDGCRADCLGLEVCGDGLLDILEECDDENIVDADGCEADCSLPACENGIKDPGELCFVEKVFDIDTAPQEMVVEDLDQNGLLDIATANLAGNSINLLLNQGNEEFLVQTINLGAEGDSIVSGDFDQDGDPDLAVTLSLIDKVSVLFNNGKGQFPLVETFDIDLGPTEMTAADLDGDEDIDLAVAHDQSDSVVVFLNNGTGQFTFEERFSFGGSITGLASADLNNNGTVDLVSSNAEEDTLNVILNLGKEGFFVGAPFASGIAPGVIKVADLDGDQNLDLAVTHGGISKELRVFFGQGDATFLPSELVFTFTLAPSTLAFGDMDQDGFLDMVVPESFGGDGIHIFLNDGAGTFSQSLLLPAEGENKVVVVADFNEDGLLDIANAEESIGLVQIFFSAP